MGLYWIAIRDDKDAAEIPVILQQHGYDVRFKSENEQATFYTCPIKRGELTFSISKGSPQRFSTGVGPVGTALVRILDEHGIFAAAPAPPS
jgi:hypothetical protein